MTTQRFEINNNIDFNDKIETFELSCIVDNDNQTFYFIVDNIENVELFVERLNKLEEKNKQLKKDIEYYKTERLTLFELLDKMNDLQLDLRCDLE